jgi:hypothetical protein
MMQLFLQKSFVGRSIYNQMRYIFFCLIVAVVVISCQSEPENVLDEEVADVSDYEVDVSFPQLDVDNPYNQLSMFLAGKEAPLYARIQKQQYYQNYKEKLENSWKETTSTNLLRIDKWVAEKKLLLNDTLPLFYPFSGPDFLYANAFFPDAPVHVMVGLENPGKLHNLAKMDDSQVSMYLYKLYHSLRYINQAGYFTTKQMQNDFTDSSMNGIIHLLCFYLAKTDHQIAKISPVQIDYYGKVKEKKNFEVADELVNGVKFRFVTSRGKYKTLYYFPLDLSDENLKDQLGFLAFITQIGEKNTFLKSASYILHSNNFEIISDLILKQSKTIIQDDTGIPFEKLKHLGYSVKLFGNYSRTINVFEKYYQPDLKQALIKEKAAPLPFKLGYNAWKNEMVIIAANNVGLSASKPVTYKIEKEGVVFKVQIKSSWKKIPDDASLFKGLPKVDYYYSDNLYKFTIGNFSSQQACEPYLQKAVKKGFKDAFVVAFYKKNRISLEEAEKIIESR